MAICLTLQHHVTEIVVSSIWQFPVLSTQHYCYYYYYYYGEFWQISRWLCGYTRIQNFLHRPWHDFLCETAVLSWLCSTLEIYQYWKVALMSWLFSFCSEIRVRFPIDGDFFSSLVRAFGKVSGWKGNQLETGTGWASPRVNRGNRPYSPHSVPTRSTQKCRGGHPDRLMAPKYLFRRRLFRQSNYFLKWDVNSLIVDWW